MMLNRDVKIYLIISRFEKCSAEEYSFRHAILRDFMSAKGDIPSSQLHVSHFVDFLAMEPEEGTTRYVWKDYMMRSMLTLERFLVWLRSQPAFPELEPAERN